MLCRGMLRCGGACPRYGHDYVCRAEEGGRPPADDAEACLIAPAPFRGAPCSDADAPEAGYNAFTRGE